MTNTEPQPDLDPWDEYGVDLDLEPEPVEDPYVLNGRMGALGRLEADLRRFDEIAAREDRERAEARTAQRRKLSDRADWLRTSLELSARAAYERDHTRTGQTLPNGTLASKHGGVSWVWPDDGTPDHARLMAWLRAHDPDLVVTPEQPADRIDKAAVKKALAPAAVEKSKEGQVPADPYGLVVVEIAGSAEVVPGLTIVAKPRTFTATPTGGPS